MSTSGRPPEEALADPPGWRRLLLGDGISVSTPAPRGGNPG
jgi:hypothetical protein